MLRVLTNHLLPRIVPTRHIVGSELFSHTVTSDSLRPHEAAVSPVGVVLHPPGGAIVPTEVLRSETATAPAEAKIPEESVCKGEKRPPPYSRTPSLFLKSPEEHNLSPASTHSGPNYQPPAPTILPLSQVPDESQGTVTVHGPFSKYLL